ncbi:MAG: DNA polymerase III subunit [Gemmatimonadota bacterium]|nr:DNA polymerase III subunit [Gemmatimonadota bacterium]
MPLLPIVGHEAERDRARRACADGRLPQVLLLTGPVGVGKQRFGLWVAQLLFCEAEGSRPCGACQPCQRVLDLTHPDLHWVMPVLSPKASDPEKQVEEVAGAIAAVIAERREQPLYQPADGMWGHFLATARVLQRRAALTPVAGARKVFLVAEANRLVPQEANQEAANALLKLLEEPPANSQFILTAVDPNRLLPTIRSRTVPLRLGRLPDTEVKGFLGAHLGLEGAALQERVAAAQGSIGRAISLGEESDKALRAAAELLRAVSAGAAARSERAMKQGPYAARGEFTAMLDAVAMLLAEGGRAASGAGGTPSVPEMPAGPRTPRAFVEALGRVAKAREAAQGNVNPQLLLATLADDLAEVL